MPGDNEKITIQRRHHKLEGPSHPLKLLRSKGLTVILANSDNPKAEHS